MSGYNGWTNYETWLANLWMTNDGSDWMFDRAREIIQDLIDRDDTSDLRNDAINSFADELKDQTEDGASEYKLDGLLSDLLNAAIGEIDFREIAEHIVDEIPVFVAVWNMPGFMPDSDPAIFVDHDTAKAYLVESIEHSISGDDEDQNAAADRAIEELKATKDGSEVCVAFDNYVYSVSVL
jgi:hypothetical protein